MDNAPYKAKHPAAFINIISETGTKAEAIEWLQRTWDELEQLRQRRGESRSALRGLLREVEYAIAIGELPHSWTHWAPIDVAISNARKVCAS